MAGDALWPNVVVSFDPEGTNGAAMSQVDNRGNSFVAQAGTPIYSTSWSASGSASVYFNGSIRAQCANNNGLNFGSGDFEVNLWIYQTVRTSPWACILGFGQDTPTAQGWRLLIGPTGQISVNLHAGGGIASTNTSIVPLNAATHIAFGRSGGADFLYVNGVAAAFTGSFGTLVSYGGVLQLSGTIGPNWLYAGYLDRLEIIKGAARHTAAFTPETSAFVPYAGQVSGVVRDSAGALAARAVRAYRRDTGALVGSTTSAVGTGAYSLDLPTLNEVTVLALDSATSGTYYNDQAIRVIPA